VTHHPLRRLALLAVVLIAAGLGLAGAAHAYSYAAAGAEPLIDHRAALLGAIAKGDWSAAGAAYQGMAADVAYLDQNEDAGIAKVFADALAAKSADAVRQALMRAYADEIERRLRGARDNLKDYQAAKVLVVKAQRFEAAMAGDLAPATRKTVEDALKAALDAIGNPGVFGFGKKPADPAAFAKAHAAIHAALGEVGRGKPPG
jgi:hypothetical protein